MKKHLVVHTQNKVEYLRVPYTSDYQFEYIEIPNVRFGKEYKGSENNTDRLTIVGIPNEDTKELSIGIAFASYPDNFCREVGIRSATMRAAGEEYLYGTTSTGFLYKNYKPYKVIQLEEFNQEACLEVLYTLHNHLITKSVKEVKKLVNQQIVK